MQQGKPGHYVFTEGTPEQHKLVTEAMEGAYRQSYAAYQEMLEAGVAREVARAVLPVGVFSTMYATCNARSLMHFLSLRTQHEQARVPSFPQREIEMVAERMEEVWAGLDAPHPRRLHRQRQSRPLIPLRSRVPAAQASAGST